MRRPLPSQAKDIYHFKEEYIVYSCKGTTSFGAICEFKNQTETNKQKKRVKTVAYLLLLSNTSQEILPGIASVFYSFDFYLPEKCISQLHQNKYAQNPKREKNDNVLLSTI